jgi:cytochrome c556
MRSDGTMTPKFSGLPALATLVATVLAAGLTTGTKGGDDSPIDQIMDQVLTRNRAIGKRLRSPTALEADGRKAMAADAASLIQLGKEARALAEPARERKKSQQDWTRAVDNFLQASQGFAKIMADEGSGRSQATQSYQTLQKTCVNCHSAFREEEHEEQPIPEPPGRLSRVGGTGTTVETARGGTGRRDHHRRRGSDRGRTHRTDERSDDR